MLPGCCGADDLFLELERPSPCAQCSQRPGTRTACWLQQGVAEADMPSAEPQRTAVSSTCDGARAPTSQISCRALLTGHSCKGRRMQAEQVPWGSSLGHLLTGVCRGMASCALPRHQQRICSLAPPQSGPRSSCRALQSRNRWQAQSDAVCVSSPQSGFLSSCRALRWKKMCSCLLGALCTK